MDRTEEILGKGPCEFLAHFAGGQQVQKTDDELETKITIVIPAMHYLMVAKFMYTFKGKNFWLRADPYDESEGQPHRDD